MVQQLRPALAEMKAWQPVMKPKIDEALSWQRDIGPLLTEMVANQHMSELALKAIHSDMQLLKSIPILLNEALINP